jgi:ABC-type transport system involved in multi-copper enzyme maturation permease subunit
MQFYAILKDSFREAIDGFVIYLMIGLSLLLVVILGSISYAPDAATDALPKALGREFQLIFPARGASSAPTGMPVEYHATEIEDVSNGAKFVLKVGPLKQEADQKNGQPEPQKPVDKKKDEPDMFRSAVYAWKEPAGEKIKNPFAKMGGQGKGGGRTKNEIEIVTPAIAGPADLRAITDDEMVAFLKYQFTTFVGVDVVKITRRPGIAEPEYKFDVEITGISGARGWPHSVYVFFGAVPPFKGVPLGEALYFIQDVIVNGIGAAVTLMISVVITAFFIPNLLRKGSIDLLISKPISRVGLLVYKYIGGLTFIFILSSISIGGVWLVMAARSGSWSPGFLLVIPVLTFTFAILYSVSTVVAVFTRSAIASILVTLGFMLCLYIFGQVKSFFDLNKIAAVTELPEWSYTLVDGLNTILPRYKDLDKLTTKIVVDNTMTEGQARLTGIFTEYPSWGGAVGVSLAFIAVMLALSCWRFIRRDN